MADRQLAVVYISKARNPLKGVRFYLWLLRVRAHTRAVKVFSLVKLFFSVFRLRPMLFKYLPFVYFCLLFFLVFVRITSGIREGIDIVYLFFDIFLISIHAIGKIACFQRWFYFQKFHNFQWIWRIKKKTYWIETNQVLNFWKLLYATSSKPIYLANIPIKNSYIITIDSWFNFCFFTKCCFYLCCWK